MSYGLRKPLYVSNFINTKYLNNTNYSLQLINSLNLQDNTDSSLLDQTEWSTSVPCYQLQQPTDLQHSTQPRDCYSEIICTYNTLKQLGCINGSYIQLRNTQQPQYTCIGRIYIHTNELCTTLCDNQLWLNPLLYTQLQCNILYNDTCTPSTVQVHKITTPTVADRIIVSRVKSPESSGTLNYDKQLKAYFSVAQRIMCEGQIFGIPLHCNSSAAKHSWAYNSEPLRSQHKHNDNVQYTDTLYDDTDCMSDSEYDICDECHIIDDSTVRMIYFKVTSSNKLPYFIIDTQHTTLVHEGSTNSYVPYVNELYTTYQPTICPFNSKNQCLAHYNTNTNIYRMIQQLIQQVQPYTTNLINSLKIDINNSILLHGPKRSNKRIIVSNVATTLNCHYYEVNCFTLLSDSATQIESNIKSLFDTAANNTPCILHIRRFHAFKHYFTAQSQAQNSTSRETLLIDTLKQSFIKYSNIQYPVLVVCSTDNIDDISTELQAIFSHTFTLSTPNSEDRKTLVTATLQQLPIEHIVESTAAVPAITAANDSLIDNDSEDHKSDTSSEHNMNGTFDLDSDEETELQRFEKAFADANTDSLAVTSNANTDINSSTNADGSANKILPSEYSTIIASRSAGLSAGDIQIILSEAVAHAQQRYTKQQNELILNESQAHDSLFQQYNNKLNSMIEQKSNDNTDTVYSDLYADNDNTQQSQQPTLQLTKSDLEFAVQQYTKRITANNTSAAIASIPNVHWSDVGGLENVKHEILDTIELPLKYPQLFSHGIQQRSGVLLYGPPGTGKTLIAKAVATECALNFMSVKGPELLNMYIGESEKQIRDLFQRARASKPCVIFFDEIDALVPARGNNNDSGGVMARIVSQFLAELDGSENNQELFIIAATNRPDLIDSSLLRPGRLDRCVYLGVSETREQQLNILNAVVRKFKLHSNLNLAEIVETCPYTYTGADFYALGTDAMLNAVKRKIQHLDEQMRELDEQRELQWNLSNVQRLDTDTYEHITVREYLTSLKPEQLDVIVEQNDFVYAKSVLTPSLSQAELDRYKALQGQFQNNRKAAKVKS